MARVIRSVDVKSNCIMREWRRSNEPNSRCADTMLAPHALGLMLSSRLSLSACSGKDIKGRVFEDTWARGKPEVSAQSLLG